MYSSAILFHDDFKNIYLISIVLQYLKSHDLHMCDFVF